MGKLTELFDERERAYAKYNNEILSEIEKNVIPAVLEMLQLSDDETNRLEWTNVQTTEEHLVLSGIISYKEGDVVTTDEDTITLDAAMALMLEKVVRVAIPIELAETGSRMDILEHLERSQQELRKEYESVYGHEPATMEEAMEQAMLGQLGMDFGPDFDYNELTEEQKESLFMSMTGSTGGEKIN